MLHQILRFEMRTRVVFRSHRMHDGQRSVAIRRFESAEQRIQPEKSVQGDGVLLVDGNARPRSKITVILDGRDHVEAVRAAAKEDNDQRPRIVTIACNERLHLDDGYN